MSASRPLALARTLRPFSPMANQQMLRWIGPDGAPADEIASGSRGKVVLGRRRGPPPRRRCRRRRGPCAMPTSAAASEGASLIPSPTWPRGSPPPGARGPARPCPPGRAPPPPPRCPTSARPPPPPPACRRSASAPARSRAPQAGDHRRGFGPHRSSTASSPAGSPSCRDQTAVCRPRLPARRGGFQLRRDRHAALSQKLPVPDEQAGRSPAAPPETASTPSPGGIGAPERRAAGRPRCAAARPRRSGARSPAPRRRPGGGPPSRERPAAGTIAPTSGGRR